MIDVLVNLD